MSKIPGEIRYDWYTSFNVACATFLSKNSSRDKPVPGAAAAAMGRYGCHTSVCRPHILARRADSTWLASPTAVQNRRFYSILDLFVVTLLYINPCLCLAKHVQEHAMCKSEKTH